MGMFDWTHSAGSSSQAREAYDIFKRNVERKLRVGLPEGASDLELRRAEKAAAIKAQETTHAALENTGALLTDENPEKKD